MEENRKKAKEKFREEIQRVPYSPVQVSRTIERSILHLVGHYVQILERIDAKKDERILESRFFLNDDSSIKSKEFIVVLYKHKGKLLRLSIPNISPRNEQELMSNIKEDIKREAEHMTLERGRQLLNEVGVMALPSWELSASYIFDSLIKSGK